MVNKDEYIIYNLNVVDVMNSRELNRHAALVTPAVAANSSQSQRKMASL